jgi:hypothetical protein
MSKYMIAVSCPRGKEYHKELKKAFPNLSSKIMTYLDEEFKKVKGEMERKDVQARRLWQSVYPVYKSMVGNMDPWDWDETETVEKLKVRNVMVTLDEAQKIRMRAENEYLEKTGGR